MSTIVYTGKGDDGKTRLYDGNLLSKDHIVFNLLGKIDELNVSIGELKILIKENSDDQSITHQEQLYQDHHFFTILQKYLMDISSDLATINPDKRYTLKLTNQLKLSVIEGTIHRLNEKCPKLTEFLIPGVCSTEILAHRCRVQVREIERLLTSYTNTNINENTNTNIDLISNYLIRSLLIIFALFCTIYTPVGWYCLIPLVLLYSYLIPDRTDNNIMVINQDYVNHCKEYIPIFNRLSSLFFVYARISIIRSDQKEETKKKI